MVRETVATPLEWKGLHLWLGGLWIGQVMKWSSAARAATPWRGWLMTEEDGEETGWYATEGEAREDVATKARAALSKTGQA